MLSWTQQAAQWAMSFFQKQDALHWKKIISSFSIFKIYHIEIFQREFKKITYACNNTLWNQTYIGKKMWENDPLLKHSENIEEDLYIFQWEADDFKGREHLGLAYAITKIYTECDFLQAMSVGFQKEDDLLEVFNALDTLFNKPPISSTTTFPHQTISQDKQGLKRIPQSTIP